MLGILQFYIFRVILKYYRTILSFIMGKDPWNRGRIIKI